MTARRLIGTTAVIGLVAVVVAGCDMGTINDL